jgi:hypothetical protein
MKTTKAMVVFLAIAFLFTSQAVFAHPRGRGYLPPPPDGGIGLFTREVHDEMFAEVVAELTGKEVDTIMQELEDKHPKAVLQEYDIAPENFRSAMDAKMIEVVKESAEKGSITQLQADEIIERIQNRAVGSRCGPPTARSE